MKAMTLICLLLISLISFSHATLRPQAPTIGIISTPSDYAPEYEPERYSYIKETYPNFIKKAGGFPIFIPYNLSDSELLPLLKEVNGILLIGGDTKLWETNEETGVREFTSYVRQIQKIISIVKKANDENTYLPLMGICEGMETVLLGLTNDPYLLDNFENLEAHAPLSITSEGRGSKMFRGLPSNQIEYLQDLGTLFFSHQFGYNLSALDNYAEIQQSLSMTAIAQDKNENEFIAAMEGKDWPLYLVMFHPERTSWENEAAKFSHHKHVVDFTDKLADFFVKEAMKNKRKVNPKNNWKKWDFNRFEAITIDEDKPKVYLAEGGKILHSKNKK